MALTVEALLATAELDSSGFARGLDRISQGLERYDRQAAALTGQPVALTLDTTASTPRSIGQWPNSSDSLAPSSR